MAVSVLPLHSPDVTNQWSNGYTFSNGITPNANCKIAGVRVFTGTAHATASFVVSVWSTSSVRLVRGDATLNVVAGGAYDILFTAPLSLVAGTRYLISVYSSLVNLSGYTANPGAHSHTGTGRLASLTLSLDGTQYYNQGDTTPLGNFSTTVETGIWPLFETSETHSRTAADSTGTSDAAIGVNLGRVPLYRYGTEGAPVGFDAADRFDSASVYDRPEDVSSVNSNQVFDSALGYDADASYDTGVFDRAERQVLFIRTASDSAPAVEAVPYDAPYAYDVEVPLDVGNPQSTVLHVRALADSAPAAEALTHQALAFRYAFDGLLPDVDSPLGYDNALGYDTNDLSADLGSNQTYDSALTFDAAKTYDGGTQDQIASKVFLFRSAVDTAPAIERVPYDASLSYDLEVPLDVGSPHHQVLHIRAPADSAPANDAPTHLTSMRRYAFDGGLVGYSSDLPYDAQVPFDYLPSDVDLNGNQVFDSALAFDSTLTYDAGTHDHAVGVRTQSRFAADSVPVVTDNLVRQGWFSRWEAEVLTTGAAASRLLQLVRSATDSAPATDGPVEWSLTNRPVLHDYAGPVMDYAERGTVVFKRGPPPDAAPASDSLTVRRLLARTGLDTAPATDAAALHGQYLVREAVEEPLYTASVNERAVARSRTTSDEAPAEGEATRLQRLARRCTEVLLRPADLALGMTARVRWAYDLAPASDRPVRHLVLVRRALDVAPLLDTLVRRGRAFRQASDAAPASETLAHLRRVSRWSSDIAALLDGADRVKHAFRSTYDYAPVTDQGGTRRVGVGAFEVVPVPLDVATWVLRRFVRATAADLAPAVEGASRVVGTRRTSNDQAGSLAGSDDAVRTKRAFRATWDTAPLTEAASRRQVALRQALDAAPVSLDAHALLTAVRAAQDVVPVPLDQGWFQQSNRVPVGPPVATVLSVSRYRVGLGDCGLVEVAFEFDQPVTAWSVRFNSRSAFDGTVADEWVLSQQPGFGRQAFGRYPFGRRARMEEWRMEDVAHLTSDGLLHGDNDVVVYGRDLDGFWSAHPVGGLTAASRG